MPSADQQDKERIRRIQQAQIAARNPGESKIKGYDWKKHSAKPKAQQKPLLIEFYGLLPPRWRGILGGAALATPIALAMLIFLPYEYHVAALIPYLLCGIVGFVIGSLFEEKRENW